MDFSKLQLADGTEVNVKDANARTRLTTLESSVTTLGEEALKSLSIPKDSTQSVTGHTTYTYAIDNIDIINVEFYLGSDPAAIDYTITTSGGNLVVTADTDGLDAADIPEQVKITYKPLTA